MNHPQRILWLPLLLLLIPVSARSQNWHPFPYGKVPIFKFTLAGDTIERFLASRIDSVRQEGAAMAHYFYRIDRPVAPGEVIVGCAGGLIQYPDGYALDQDHYFGQKALLYPDGKCTFWTTAGDSFVLETKATVGQSWTFHGNVTATMQQFSMDSVFGALDSVRVYALSDGREIRLTRRFGISRMPNLLPFNLHSGALKDCDFLLDGEQTSGFGTTLPTFYEIFDFDQGDRIGIMETGSYGLGYDWIEGILTTYLGRNLSYHWAYNTNYDYDRLDYQQFGPPIHFQSYGQVATYVYDTADYIHLNRLPYEHNPEITYMQYPTFIHSGMHRSSHHGRIMQSFLELSSWMSGVYDSCSNTIANGRMAETFYVEGLGRVRRTVYVNLYPTVWRMLCYTKGKEIFGNCGTFVVGDEEPMQMNGDEFMVYPSVTQQFLNIEWKIRSHQIPFGLEILSADGRILFATDRRETAGTLNLDIASWPTGVYMVRVHSGGKDLKTNRFVKVD